METQENGKMSVMPVGPKFGPPIFFFFFKKSGFVRHKLSSCTISEKINDPILRKFSDKWTDGTDRQRQMDESYFIGRCPTNVERPKIDQNLQP